MRVDLTVASFREETKQKDLSLLPLRVYIDILYC